MKGYRTIQAERNGRRFYNKAMFWEFVNACAAAVEFEIWLRAEKRII